MSNNKTVLTLLLTSLLLAGSASLMAMPALPGTFRYTQPDGTTLLLERHGDEFLHWTTLAGTSEVVALDEDGFYRPSSIPASAREAARVRRERAGALRSAARSTGKRTHSDNIMTHGERHIPVLLVNFQDVTFKISDPHEQFTAMLNENGYSRNSATGSVQDFYMDNSNGAFTPVFDVYGPVTLPNNMAYYGANSGGFDGRPELALFDAAVILDEEVDFSQYDVDYDGYVDMILFYYAGYSEAEGGPANSIWPHSWSVQESSSFQARTTRFDGKLLANYFCTAELKGGSGTRMCGIGPTCHEFGHSLGLPDFYDTDYEANGYAGGLYSFSTMCSGGYNNNSCTPPYFNAEERVLLDWMIPDDIQPLPHGQISFASVKGDIAYKSLTSVEGEYFLYECRDGSGWDAPLPKGLLIYHVDKAKTHKVGWSTAYDLWEYWEYTNSINANGSHPCFYIIPSYDPSSLNFYYSSEYIIFPGSGRVTSYTPITWDKMETGMTVSGISYSSGQVTLTAKYDSPQEEVDSLAEMGFSSIADPGYGHYQPGYAFALDVLVAKGLTITSPIKWTLDGKEVASGSKSVTIQAGTHILTASFALSDGTGEKLELIVCGETVE